MVYPALEAAEKLASENINATVVNARFVKPLDAESILSLASKHQTILTVEEAYLSGGFGSAVMELLEENGLLENTSVHRMGVADEIVTHGDPKILLSHYGLNPDGIAAKAKEMLSEKSDKQSSSHRLKAVK